MPSGGGPACGVSGTRGPGLVRGTPKPFVRVSAGGRRRQTPNRRKGMSPASRACSGAEAAGKLSRWPFEGGLELSNGRTIEGNVKLAQLGVRTPPAPWQRAHNASSAVKTRRGRLYPVRQQPSRGAAPPLRCPAAEAKADAACPTLRGRAGHGPTGPGNPAENASQTCEFISMVWMHRGEAGVGTEYQKYQRSEHRTCASLPGGRRAARTPGRRVSCGE